MAHLKLGTIGPTSNSQVYQFFCQYNVTVMVVANLGYYKGRTFFCYYEIIYLDWLVVLCSNCHQAMLSIE